MNIIIFCLELTMIMEQSKCLTKVPSEVGARFKNNVPSLLHSEGFNSACI